MLIEVLMERKLQQIHAHPFQTLRWKTKNITIIYPLLYIKIKIIIQYS